MLSVRTERSALALQTGTTTPMEGAAQARATGSANSPGGVPLAVLVARLSQAELRAMLEHHEGAHAHALQDVEVRGPHAPTRPHPAADVVLCSLVLLHG